MPLLDFTRAPHGGRVRLLPESGSSPTITPKLLIFHSAVSPSLDSTYRYFRDLTDLESTLGIGLDGYIEQWMDTLRHADANYRANPYAISVETMDNGDPDHYGWTGPQFDSMEWVAWEVNRIHPEVKLIRAPDCDGPGIGYHTMWGAPSCWTPVAKTCPGRARIAQFPELLRRIQGEGLLSAEVEELKQFIRDQFTVQGSTSPLDAQEKLFSRERRIEAGINQLLGREPFSAEDIIALGAAVAATVNANVDCDIDEAALGDALAADLIARLAS